MSYRVRLGGFVAAVVLVAGADAFPCGDKFLVGGRGTRYQRPKNARAASIVIYANPASGFPATVGKVPVESVLKREGHRSTTVETLDQLAAILAGGRFDVVLAAGAAVSAVQGLLGGAPDAPVLVSFCAKPGDPKEPGRGCAVAAPPKERSLLEEIDKAVLRHDKSVQKAPARG